MQTDFQTPCWYQAATLTERLASLREAQAETANVTLNAELAHRRLERWRSQLPFQDGSAFAQRLATDELSEEEFYHLLGEPIEAVQDRYPAPPAWLVGLAEAFSQRPFSEPIPLPDTLLSQPMAGILDTIGPLISQGRSLVQQGIQELIQTWSNLPFDPDTIEYVLFANLPRRLIQMMSRTMVLELHVMRLQGQLQGDTSEERFQSFLQRMRDRDTALTILQEYPVLARQLILCINRWVATSLELLQRLCIDWQMIQTTFCSGSDPGLLVEAAGGAGDEHRGGRSVMIIKFSSGFQVVYKPRPLAVDVHFQELLKWINDRGDHPPFQTLNILGRGSYGWVEFVAARSCTSLDEVQRFYERQGGYLALLYALEAADFHCENVIASGEHPVLVDLEALFHPNIDGFDPGHAEEIANSTLIHSVLGIGLLPSPMWSNAEGESIDISGLGAAAGQLMPHGVPQWEGAGTDEMRLTRKRVTMPGAQNRPSFHGADVDVLAYSDAIMAGFANIYRLLLKYRADLSSEDGPIARFAQDEVRVILRATRTYGLLLHESFHPDVLHNALDRDRLFDRLWGRVEQLPYLAKVIPAERQDLLQGDIPVFTMHPMSRDLRSSSGERITDFFDEPGLTLVEHRLQRLSEDDLAQQLWIIRASLATLSTSGERELRPKYRLPEPQTIADRENLVAAARAVGDRLETLGVRGEHDVSWIGLTSTTKDHWSLAPLGMDLYDGIPGVALFLAYLGAVTQEGRYTALAQAALGTLRRQIERNPAGVATIGGFVGWGGVIYTLTHLATLWDQPALLAEAEAIVDRVPDLVGQDKQLDTIGGGAGCIGSLISLYRCAKSDRTLAAAVQCGDWLIACAQQMEHGIGWIPPGTGTKPLTGFAHGGAGIAWALLELAAITGEERFRAAARAAIDYERSVFSPKAGNWPDLRDQDTFLGQAANGEDSFMVAWCHGAPGIGLARLQALPHLENVAICEEIYTALNTTLAQGFGRNHSLCHGNLGNLELLLKASETLDDPQWCAQVNRLAAIILESIDRDGWICANPLGTESPGLMTGLAGIGYELLRVAEPKRVPSVLLLDPPVLRR
jgi:type 2 lantibiotic biosynthesis protein LanM